MQSPSSVMMGAQTGPQMPGGSINDIINSSNEDHIKTVTEEIKREIMERCGERILKDNQDAEFQKMLQRTINDIILRRPDISPQEKDILMVSIYNDIVGFGAIQDLLDRDDITEIMVTHYDKIYAEEKGIMKLQNTKFQSEEDLMNVINKIVGPLGRRIDKAHPHVDARLPNGSRVFAIIPPVSPDGASVSIRKFSKNKLTGDDYIRFGSIKQPMIDFLKGAVEAKCNILVSGGTGSGKSTLLNMLSNYIPEKDAIITIEDSMELQLNQENVRRWEAKEASAEGTGGVSQRDLVKCSLRARPDRIVIGEIRDGTIVDLFRAFSTGHDGGLSTIHADSPKVLMNSAIPILFGMSDMTFKDNTRDQLVCDSIDLIVQVSRLLDGSRKIVNITHVAGYGRDGASAIAAKGDSIDPEKIYLQDIFRYVEDGVSEDGKVVGHFEATGYKPKKVMGKMKSHGVTIPNNLFEKRILE